MKPPTFKYHRPATLAEALALLSELPDAKILAGGLSLVPMMNMRLARPEHLIDVGRLPGLDGVHLDGDVVRLGALVRHRRVATDPLIGGSCPLLRAAARHIGHTAIRNRGTIGGSLAHAGPAAELPTALVALGGSVRVASMRGEREIPAGELFLSYFSTSILPDEMLVEVTVPIAPPESRHAFVEFARRAGDFAIVSVACQLEFTHPPGAPAHRIATARLALGGVGPTPVRCEAAEAALTGAEPSEALFAEVAAWVAESIEPESDIHGSAEYRRVLARNLTLRALRAAAVLPTAAAHGKGC